MEYDFLFPIHNFDDITWSHFKHVPNFSTCYLFQCQMNTAIEVGKLGMMLYLIFLFTVSKICDGQFIWINCFEKLFRLENSKGPICLDAQVRLMTTNFSLVIPPIRAGNYFFKLKSLDTNHLSQKKTKVWGTALFSLT